MPPLEDADAHPTVLIEIQRQQERLFHRRRSQLDVLSASHAPSTAAREDESRARASEITRMVLWFLNQARSLNMNGQHREFHHCLQEACANPCWLSPPPIFQPHGFVVCSSMIR